MSGDVEHSFLVIAILENAEKAAKSKIKRKI